MKKKLKKVNNQSFILSLENFEGPLDLLLHLARSNEIEISDLCLDVLISQYIEFIEKVEQLGVDVASCYLEMAAELIRLKSQTLLPNLQKSDDILEEMEELGFDRETLIQKLLEYKKYKDISDNLDNLSEERSSLLSRKPSDLVEYKSKSESLKIDIELFINATKKYLINANNKDKETKILSHNEISVEDQMKYLRNIKGTTSIIELLDSNTISNKITLFLAILEALKEQFISFKIIDDEVYITSNLNREIDE